MPKKTKSIKVTDIKAQKPWLKKAKPSVYKIETKATNKTILIICEGQTEKLYFESFPVLTLTVEVVDLEGQSKLKLIESANAIIEQNDKEYDEVWCVFDMDIKQGKKELSDYDNAINKGKKLGFNIAYSNDAFELWFYLHYQYTEQKNHRKYYYQTLSNKWNINYEKDGKKRKFCLAIYNRLEEDELASQNKAIERADKLFKRQQHLIYHEQNPVTLVYELVKFLNKNKRR